MANSQNTVAPDFSGDVEKPLDPDAARKVHRAARIAATEKAFTVTEIERDGASIGRKDSRIVLRRDFEGLTAGERVLRCLGLQPMKV